jgi:hypothetical protein
LSFKREDEKGFLTTGHCLMKTIVAYWKVLLILMIAHLITMDTISSLFQPIDKRRIGRETERMRKREREKGSNRDRSVKAERGGTERVREREKGRNRER